MRRAVLAFLLASIVPAAPAQAATCGGANTVPTVKTMKAARAATLCLLNGERRSRGLAALRSDSRLQAAATRFSRQMVRERFFDHTAPDGMSFDERVVSAGYRDSRTLAENIAWGSGSEATPAQIVDGWMHSPGHRRNILNGELRDIGVGIASGAPQDVGGQPAATYTTDFGRRL
jgi:uncharacterized protein YkwD